MLAGELRLAVTRTARRLRQQAGGPLSPTLACGAGHGGAPRAADAVRARAARGGRAADRDEGGHEARGTRLRGPGRRPRRRPLGADRSERGLGRPCSPRSALVRTPISPSGSRRSGRRTARRSPGRRGCSTTSRAPRRRLEPGPRSHVRLAARPELPALLRRPGRIDHGQLDADGRRDVADRPAHRLGRRGGPDRRRCSSCRCWCSAPTAAFSPTGSTSAAC